MRISDWSSDVCSSDLKGDDAPVDARLLELLHRLRIGGFLAGGRKGEEHRSADAAEQSEGARADDRERGEEKHKPERAEREIEVRDEARIGHEDAGPRRRDGQGERGADRSEEHTAALQSLRRNSSA